MRHTEKTTVRNILVSTEQIDSKSDCLNTTFLSKFDSDVFS